MDARPKHGCPLKTTQSQENLNSKKGKAITSKQQFDFVTQVNYLSEGEIGLSIWDMAAGSLFVKETGGVIFDIMEQSSSPI